MSKGILFYDTETSGLPSWDLPADHPSQPHIVDLAGILVDDAGAELARYESLIRPDGWRIDAKTAEIHGITQAIATRDGVPILEALDRFEELVARCNMIAAYNLRFDEKLLRGERRRLGRPDGFGEIPVFCCMKAATPLCKIPPTAKMRAARFTHFKTPNLSEAVKLLLKREHAGAHRAMADALAARDIYFAHRHDEAFMQAGADFKTNKERA